MAWDTDTKLHFFHGTADLNVPPEQSQDMYNNLLIAGADPYIVEYVDLYDMDHAGGVLPWGISTINWFNSLEGR
jgi:hypothetical protein